MGFRIVESTGILDGCTAEGNRMGVYIGPGSHVTSRRGTYRNNGGADVDNHGRFDGADDQIG